MFFVVAKSSAIHGISHSNFQVGSNLNSKTLAQTPMIRVSFSFRTKVCENLKCFKKGKKPCNAWHDTVKGILVTRKKHLRTDWFFFPIGAAISCGRLPGHFFDLTEDPKSINTTETHQQITPKFRLIFWIDLFQLKTKSQGCCVHVNLGSPWGNLTP